jgi:hypothetical protein
VYDCPTAQPISGNSCSISGTYYCYYSGGAVRCACSSSTWDCENLSGYPGFGATGVETGDGGGAGRGSEQTGGETGDGGGAGQGSEQTGGAPAQTGGASATGGVEDTGCPTSQPGDGDSCDGLGEVCAYSTAECVCSSSGWLCGTTVPDCPPDTPGDGVSCGLVGQPCEYADGSCVCTSANEWLCL